MNQIKTGSFVRIKPDADFTYSRNRDKLIYYRDQRVIGEIIDSEVHWNRILVDFGSDEDHSRQYWIHRNNLDPYIPE